MSKELDLTNYLTSHGIQVFRANGNEITAHCFMGCGGGDTKGKGKWYGNRETWLYDCKKCGSQGNRKTLLEHFGDEDELKVAGTDPMLKRRILLEAAEMAHEMLLGNQKKLDYLLERGISGDLIVSRKLGYVPKNVGLSEMLPVKADLKGYEALVEAGLVQASGREFFNDALVIPYFSHGQVVQLRAKFVDGKYLTAAGDQVRIYNEAALHGADDILVVEGEYDSLALETNIALAPERTFPLLGVIGLPGAGSWPEDLLDRLSGARRVFIGMDPDETGKKFAAKLADEVGAKARIVNLPEGEPKVDWTDWFKPRTPINRHGGHTWQDLRDLLVESDLAGKQMFSIQDIASKWGKRQEDAPGLKLGWPSIDAIIRPGLKPGQVFIPLATTGCIQGDAAMVVNRGGAARRTTLRDLVAKFNGGSVQPPGAKRSYSWDLSIPTMVQREVDGEVRLGRVKAAWASGIKQTYTVMTESGREVRATDEHPFLTERGWLRLDQLTVGDLVHVRGEQTSRGRTKINYRQVYGLLAHPYAGRKDAERDRGRYPMHRLVAEASLNDLDVDSFIGYIRSGHVDDLKFLDPAEWAVHHIDHDPANNEPANLKVFTHEEHAALHAAEGTTSNVQIQIAHERVTSVVPYGLEETFDIEVEDNPHNFIANGFVVHNTGKSVFLANLTHNLRESHGLFVSLELTGPEIFEFMRRIHRFHFPDATVEQLYEDYRNLQVTEMNRVGKSGLSDLIHEYQDIQGVSPDYVIIDYLQYLSRGFRGGSLHERATDAIMEVKAVGKEEEMVMIIPSQVNRGAERGKPIDLDSARDSGAIEETADFVMGLFRPDQLSPRDTQNGETLPQTGDMRAQLLKSRHGGAGRTFSLKFSMMSLVITDALLDRRGTMRVEQENALIRQGIHYDDHRKQQDESIAQGVLI